MAVTAWTDLYCTNTNYFTPAGGYYAPILPTAGGSPNWVNDLVDALRIWPADVSANGHNLNNVGALSTGGAVGIGITPATVALDVNGALRVRGQLTTAVANTSCIDNTGAGLMRLVSYGPNSSTPGAYEFLNQSSDGSIGSPVMYITPGGAVGLSTTAPAANLHVKQGTGTDNIPAGTWTGIFHNLVNGSGQNGLLLKNTWQGSDSTLLLAADTNNKQLFRIDGLGNVYFANRTNAMGPVVSAVGVIGLAQSEAVPSANPANGVYIFVDGSGNLLCRTRAGNVRTLAAV